MAQPHGRAAGPYPRQRGQGHTIGSLPRQWRISLSPAMRRQLQCRRQPKRISALTAITVLMGGYPIGCPYPRQWRRQVLLGKALSRQGRKSLSPIGWRKPLPLAAPALIAPKTPGVAAPALIAPKAPGVAAPAHIAHSFGSANPHPLRFLSLTRIRESHALTDPSQSSITDSDP